ncbi:MAG: SpoIID/LytB domain-containing protein, partial [Proteobacteria bacterium]
MRQKLFPLLTISALSLAFALSAHASVVPPKKGRKPASLPSLEEVRVQLGQFSRASISGQDLLLDNRQTLEGNVTFSLRCGANADGPFIDYGGGRVASGRLEVTAPGGFLRVDGKLYRQRLTVLARGNSCTVINTVSLEKYLAGLINKEMVPSWPIEALKAQAVAARTYALYQAQQNHGKDYDLDSSVLDQVYDGAASETPRSTSVVDATKGEVLAFANQPLKAYFHANCGGMTEVPVTVWGSEDQAFRPVVCPYHQRKRDRTRW